MHTLHTETYIGHFHPMPFILTWRYHFNSLSNCFEQDSFMLTYHAKKSQLFFILDYSIAFIRLLYSLLSLEGFFLQIMYTISRGTYRYPNWVVNFFVLTTFILWKLWRKNRTGKEEKKAKKNEKNEKKAKKKQSRSMYKCAIQWDGWSTQLDQQVEKTKEQQLWRCC